MIPETSVDWKAFEYEIAGEYEDAGKSGKSIVGRAEVERKGRKVEWRSRDLSEGCSSV